MSRSAVASRPCLLVVGDWRAEEFSGPIRDMKQYSSVRCLSTVDEAIATLQRGFAPTHVIFAQARRGRFSDRDVARVHRLCPLAQLIALLGTWCEGETRTGAPLAGVARIYWHQWRPHLLARQQDPRHLRQWAQPRTFTLFDQSLQSSERFVQPAETYRGDSTSIAIGARRQSDYQGLAESLDSFQTYWANRPEQSIAPHDDSDRLSRADWLIWDAQAWDSIERNALNDTLRQLTPRATLLLMSWPRREDIQAADQMGVNQVLSMPFRLDDLISVLQLPRRAAA